ncbi:HEAT repeat domain-containing protein [Streptomyces sp. 43Y-GA-1]|uniref:HEAT repeat domain-containing protein n=1 Tax=Streptomyces sp. 43Y-GA-1 TaxID=2939435 RepID=UPI0027E572F1|nr:HEAT repeat domain-containing protein [Streptomyces sp. 43Y-GA-1]
MTSFSLLVEEVVSMTVTGHDTGAGRGTSAGTGADAGAVRALRGLEDGRPAVRLRAALAVGTTPDPRFVDKLVERSAVEPDFFVRDMLTWALTRHPVSVTLPRLLGEVRSERASARSQALHTLSKIGDRRAWPAITRALLTDADDEVARSAWRAAVVLVPEEEEVALGALLATQLGRGGPETRLSLSRALIALGDAMASALAAAAKDPDPRVRAHALATDRLLRDPDAGFTFALEEAKRVVALGAGSGKGGGSGGSSGEAGEASGSGESGEAGKAGGSEGPRLSGAPAGKGRNAC